MGFFQVGPRNVSEEDTKLIGLCGILNHMRSTELYFVGCVINIHLKNCMEFIKSNVYVVGLSLTIIGIKKKS